MLQLPKGSNRDLEQISMDPTPTVFHPPKHKYLAEILNIGEKLSKLCQIVTPAFAKSNGLTFVLKFREKCENENFVHAEGGRGSVIFPQASCTVHVLLRRSLKLFGARADGMMS